MSTFSHIRKRKRSADQHPRCRARFIGDLGAGQHPRDFFLPAGLIERGESLILGETEFKYTSAFAQVVKQPIYFKRSYYLRPRTQDRIVCTDC